MIRRNKKKLLKVGNKNKISRRKFIARSALGGTALILGTVYLARNPIRRKIASLANTGELPYVGNTSEPLMWFEVNANNTITLHCPKVEMGQGTFTGLAQIAAEELEVSMEQIRVVHASTATGNIDGLSTGGSTSISSLWQSLRELAATMREMLKIEAARKMDVPKNELVAENAHFSARGQSLSYGEVVQGVSEWEIPPIPELKDPSNFKYIGKGVPRVDLNEKVLGAPIFGMDVQMPDMLYGAVLRSSAIGASLVSADTSVAEKMPGVIEVIKEKDFVGVIAESYMEAENAKIAIVD